MFCVELCDVDGSIRDDRRYRCGKKEDSMDLGPCLKAKHFCDAMMLSLLGKL